jgi:hypothetical protein
MGFWDIALLLALAVLAYLSVRAIIKNKGGCASCKNCGSRGGCEGCPARRQSR